MKTREQVKPCDMPCPKCGSSDIYREFHAKGSFVENDDYDVPPCELTQGQCYSYKAVADIIKHNCRCCQYDWATRSMN